MDKKELIRKKSFLKRKKKYFEIKKNFFNPLINLIKKISKKKKLIFQYIIQVLLR